MQFYGISFMRPYKQSGSPIDQTAYRNALESTIKFHVQVFLRLNTWMFETCRRHYN